MLDQFFGANAAAVSEKYLPQTTLEHFQQHFFELYFVSKTTPPEATEDVPPAKVEELPEMHLHSSLWAHFQTHSTMEDKSGLEYSRPRKASVIISPSHQSSRALP
jgi:hypothetical protein